MSAPRWAAARRMPFCSIPDRSVFWCRGPCSAPIISNSIRRRTSNFNMPAAAINIAASGEVPVVLGVPADWDGTGDYPIAEVEVFAVDRPAGFDGGVFGVGFGIGGLADGGPARNPLLHMSYQGERLKHGYIVSVQGVDVGLTTFNTEGFAFIALQRDISDEDWMQPFGSIDLSGDFSADGYYVDLPILMDTGIDDMILWVGADDAPPNLAGNTAFPAGISVNLSAPPADSGSEPVLQYSFMTGDISQPMAPTQVEWRIGNGINTGRNVLAGADYLFDAAAGKVGFRVPPE